MDRQTFRILVGGGVAVVFVVLLLWISRRPPASPPLDGGSGPSEHRVDREDVKRDASPRQQSVEKGDRAGEERLAAAAGQGVSSDAAVGDASDQQVDWHSKREEDFSAEEKESLEETARVVLGDYSVGVGEEFNVTVRLYCPALAEAVFVFEYDPEVLAPVADSAVPLGSRGIRHGVEFYVTPAKKRVVLLCAGTPGMKKVDALDGTAVAEFRVRVLDQGDGMTALTAAQNMCFVGASGKRLSCEFAGGQVRILP